MPPKPSDSDRSDECETTDRYIMHEPEEEGRSLDVSSLLAHSNVPSPLHVPMPKDAHGRPSWERLDALVVAVSRSSPRAW